MQAASLAPPRRIQRGTIRRVRSQGDAASLIEGLRERHPAAVSDFYLGFVDKVHRVLFRMLGPDSELEDAVHDTFLRALESIDTLREPKAIGIWLIGIAINSARIRIQTRRRRRWLQLFAPEDIPEPIFSDRSPELGESVQALSRVLGKMPADERIAVVLRLAEAMTISEAAGACGVSVSTFKRRFVRGRKTLRALVALEPALRDWLKDDDDSQLAESRGPRESQCGLPSRSRESRRESAQEARTP